MTFGSGTFTHGRRIHARRGLSGACRAPDNRHRQRKKKPVPIAAGVVTSRRESHGSRAWMNVRAWPVSQLRFILSRWRTQSQGCDRFAPGLFVFRGTRPANPPNLELSPLIAAAS